MPLLLLYCILGSRCLYTLLRTYCNLSYIWRRDFKVIHNIYRACALRDIILIIVTQIVDEFEVFFFFFIEGTEKFNL